MAKKKATESPATPIPIEPVKKEASKTTKRPVKKAVQPAEPPSDMPDDLLDEDGLGGEFFEPPSPPPINEPAPAPALVDTSILNAIPPHESLKSHNYSRSSANPTPKPKSMAWVGWVFFALLVTIIIVALWYVFKDDAKPKPKIIAIAPLAPTPPAPIIQAGPAPDFSLPD